MCGKHKEITLITDTFKLVFSFQYVEEVKRSKKRKFTAKQEEKHESTTNM